MSDYRYTRRTPPVREGPRALFYGRQFAWIARTMVKVAKEVGLTNAQTIKMFELLADELTQTNPRFNRKLWEQHVRVAALDIKALEQEGANA